jgi:hypothetical protein
MSVILGPPWSESVRDSMSEALEGRVLMLIGSIRLSPIHSCRSPSDTSLTLMLKHALAG